MEHLDLFTPVEQFKAKHFGWYLVVMKNVHTGSNEEGYKQFSPETGFYENKHWSVTHVLDLYKLTTKERASTCIEEATVETYENCTSYQDAENVSEKFKNLL